MTNTKQIAILTGGKSSERDIALQSAENIMKFLTGRYLMTLFDIPRQLDDFLLRRREFDVVIPVFHGRGGEDGTVQSLLETLGMPYLFSGVEAHAIGMNKNLSKRIISSAGIKTAPWLVMTKTEKRVVIPQHFPCVVKPVDGGSTQGVNIVNSSNEFEAAIEDAFKHSAQILVEDFIQGDEFTVAVIDEKDEAIAMPVIQIKSPSGFYDFDAKYGDQPAEKLCPAPISEELSESLKNAAVVVHKTIGARHLTRTDFIVDHDGAIWFLEVNTIPGLSVLFPRAVAASKKNFADVLSSWIEETCINGCQALSQAPIHSALAT